MKSHFHLNGKPSVLYGVPYPVIARISMGVRGANFPALVRGIVAIFWYGVQTYFASTALALLLNAVLDNPGGAIGVFGNGGVFFGGVLVFGFV